MGMLAVPETTINLFAVQRLLKVCGKKLNKNAKEPLLILFARKVVCVVQIRLPEAIVTVELDVKPGIFIR